MWSTTEQGLWCDCCGNLIATTREAEADDFVEPEECRQCGYPGPELVAHYHCDDFDEECWQCGGEGYVYNCFEEWACIDPEGGCDLCMERCDVCR